MKRLLFGYLYPLAVVVALLLLPLGPGTALAQGPDNAIVSDGFDSGGLDTAIWTYIDPLRDGRLSFAESGTGESWLALSVPAGSSHDDWHDGNRTPRIMQSATNADMSLEIKFASALSAPNQAQGLYFEQDDGDYLRIGLWSDGPTTRVIATRYRGGTPMRVMDVPVVGSAGVAPLFLRVMRRGDNWTILFSTDGQNWRTVESTTQALAVDRVGLYVENSGQNPAAHTAYVDYLANLEAPAPTPGDLQTMSISSAMTPLIYNEEITAGQTRARVEWHTDRPATGVIRYGLTEAYELGAISHDDPALDHDALITGLEPDTTYYFQAESSAAGSLATLSLSDTTRPLGADTGPTINVWYGDSQDFGYPAKAQKWVNILGDVTDEDGVASLAYSLNGGAPQALTIGPDGTRLASAGDFNIEMLYEEDAENPSTPYLMPMTNTVVIAATDTLSNVITSTVTVNYVGVYTTTPPSAIDWSTTAIQDVGQACDGKWHVEGDSVRTTVADRYTYDRLIAIGDYQHWDNYEVTVPITIHAFYGGDPGVGLITRWEGHGIDAYQPHRDYKTFGALGWYRFKPFTGFGRLALLHDSDLLAEDHSGRTLELGVPYYFKMRVENQPDDSILYLLKVWRVDTTEPTQWDLSGRSAEDGDAFGSVALLAHRADASFGDVTVTEIPTADELVMSSILASPGDTSAAVTWTTDVAATSLVEYGPTLPYGDSQSDGSYVTEHTIDLTGLSPDTLYHFLVTSLDAPPDPNSVTSTDLTLRTTDPTLTSGIDSDDFNTCGLNEVWQFLDPRGDSAHGITGIHTDDATLSISVPDSGSHDIWTQGVWAPRIMQPANDADFEIEIKCDSGVSAQYEAQGIVVQETDGDWLRFDFYGDGANTRLFAASGTVWDSETATYIHADKATLDARESRRRHLDANLLDGRQHLACWRCVHLYARRLVSGGLCRQLGRDASGPYRDV